MVRKNSPGCTEVKIVASSCTSLPYPILRINRPKVSVKRKSMYALPVHIIIVNKFTIYFMYQILHREELGKMDSQ